MDENIVQEKETFDTSAWDGSASNWDTPEAYCAACLIDENEGEKTKDKCHLPYKKPGSSKVNINALRTMASGRGLSAVNASKESKRKAANWIISKWQAAFGKPAPASIYQIAGKSRPGNKATFYKDAKGQMWFLGVYSNNFMDDEKEAISWTAHEEYAKWLKDTGVKPPIILMHLPQFEHLIHAVHYMGLEFGKFTPQEYNDNLLAMYRSTAIAQTQTVIPLNGFMLVVGKVFDNKREVAEKLAARQEHWGMSHGFIPLKKDGNIFTQYRSFEFTLGPIVLAANKATAISFATKDTEEFRTMAEKIGLSDEDRQLLEDLLGNPDVEEATAKARDILQRALSSAKLLDDEEKQMPPEEEKPEEEEEEDEDKNDEEAEEKLVPADSYEGLRAKIFADLHVDELAASLKTLNETVQTQAALITDLKTEIATLRQTEDEKIAAAFTQPDWTLGYATKRTEPTDEKLVDELKKNVPTGVVEDEKLKSTNPLSLGFWSRIQD